MTDLFETANDFIESMRGDYATRSVTYMRGSYKVDIDATIGSTAIEIEGVDALNVRSRTFDFLVSAADLVDEMGNIMEPEIGDIIITQFEGIAYHCRTRSLIQELVCWRWSDVYHKCRRIHTVAIRGAE